MKTYNIKTTDTETPGNLGNCREVTITHYGSDVSLTSFDDMLAGDEYAGGRVVCEDDDAPYEVGAFRSALMSGEISGEYRVLTAAEWENQVACEAEPGSYYVDVNTAVAICAAYGDYVAWGMDPADAQVKVHETYHDELGFDAEQVSDTVSSAMDELRAIHASNLTDLRTEVYDNLLGLLADGSDIRTDIDYAAEFTATNEIDADPETVRDIIHAFDGEWDAMSFDFDNSNAADANFDGFAASVANIYCAREGYDILAIGHTTDDDEDTVEHEELDGLINNPAIDDDWWDWLKGQNQVETLSFTRAMPTDDPTSKIAIIYLIAETDDIDVIVAAAKDEYTTYTLSCSYMGETETRDDVREKDFDDCQLYSELAEGMGKCDGDAFVDCAGSHQADPRNWYAGQATEVGLGPWRFGSSYEASHEYCAELVARAGLQPIVLVKDEDGDVDWDATYDEDDGSPNAQQVRALDNADWECEKN